MKNVLIIETSCNFNGGQKMSLYVSTVLRKANNFNVIWAIPDEGVLSEKLKEAGFQYFLIGKTDLPSGVKTKSSVFKYLSMSIRCIRTINSIIKKQKIDIIYAPGPASLPWSAICGNKAKAPVIWHLHHIFLDKATTKLINIFSRYKSVKKIVSVSNAVGNQISNKRARDKTTVVYNPVDFKKYSDGCFKNVAKEKWASEKNDFIICQIALIEKDKKQEMLIKAVSELKKAKYKVKCLFIGKESVDELHYTSFLKSLCLELDVNDSVYFLGYRQDVPDILKCPDSLLLVIPSFEGFPLAGLEACSAGIPVIACNQGGASEFVSVSKSGVTFEFDNYKDLANSIIECQKHRNIYSSNGLKFAEQSSMEDYNFKILNIFNTVSYDK